MNRNMYSTIFSDSDQLKHALNSPDVTYGRSQKEKKKKKTITRPEKPQNRKLGGSVYILPFFCTPTGLRYCFFFSSPSCWARRAGYVEIGTAYTRALKKKTKPQDLLS